MLTPLFVCEAVEVEALYLSILEALEVGKSRVCIREKPPAGDRTADDIDRAIADASMEPVGRDADPACELSDREQARDTARR